MFLAGLDFQDRRAVNIDNQLAKDRKKAALAANGYLFARLRHAALFAAAASRLPFPGHVPTR